MTYFRGFTLIEILIAIGLTAIITAAALTTGNKSYERGLAHNDQLLLLSALREARAEAMNDVCSSLNCAGPSAHGVLISQKKLILFEGSSFPQRLATADQIIYLSGRSSVSGSDALGIIFAPETGDVSSSSVFSLLNGQDTEVVKINTQGSISAYMNSGIRL